MLKTDITRALAAMLILAIGSVFTSANAATSDEEKIAEFEELMTFMIMARNVATADQALINNPDIGDKGITAEKVLKDAQTQFEKKMGKPFEKGDQSTLFGQARKAMVDSIREVLDEKQADLNKKGVGFKGFIPAAFRSMVATKFSEKMAGKMTFQPTAPKELLRNRRHRADDWEEMVMTTKFMDAAYPKGQAYAENTTLNDKKVFRYMKPMYYKEPCLACHGDPKGERDISGYKKEGVKLGQFAGAMSLIVYN